MADSDTVQFLHGDNTLYSLRMCVFTSAVSKNTHTQQSFVKIKIHSRVKMSQTHPYVQLSNTIFVGSTMFRKAETDV